MWPPRFDDPDLARLCDQADRAAFDALPFGALLLDGAARLRDVNRLEAEVSGLDDARHLDHAFFTRLAPCMDNPGFRGRFEAGIRSGHLDLEFRYESDLDRRAGNIRVRMLNAARPDRYWIFIKRL